LSSGVNQTLYFLVSIIFNLYAWVVILRFLLQLVHADFFNPLSQFTLKLTDFFVKPVKKVLPYKKGIDYASLALLLIVVLVKVILMMLIVGTELKPVGIIIALFAETLIQFLNVYFYLIIIVALASWFMRERYTPVLAVINKVTDPIMRPVRRFIQPVSGIDLSPIVVIILIKVIELLLLMPLLRMAGY
jgi:YggT family protein